MVIPCYKNDEFLGEALESVFAQTRRLVEIVVIDDGSPEPLTCPWVGKVPSLTWIRTSNRGLGSARNTGLRAAKTEFVAFLDADDLWEPNKLELQEELLDRFPEAVACYTRCIASDGFFAFGPYPDPRLDRDSLAAMLWNSQFFPPSSVLVRREAALRVGGFREGKANGEDLDMWFRLFTEGEIYGVDQELTWYRVHDKQITNNDIRKIMGAKEARREILRLHSDRLVRGGISAQQLWHAYRSEILGVYFRRRFESARPMLWDYLKDHPTDWRIALYLVLTLLPAGWVAFFRGRIG